MKTRDLSAATQAAIAQDVTKPGFLAEFVLPSQTIRISSRGAVTWNGANFIDLGFEVRGVSTTGGQSAMAGSLVISDADLTFATMILGESIADRPVRIWAFYGDTSPAALDPFPIFSGVADEAQIDPDGMRVTVGLMQQRIATTNAPRVFMTHENGFRHLRPPGFQISWGGEVFTLDPER